jgi:periplasmic divalent cation tolerance protein
MKKTTPIVILTTCGKEDEAEKIATTLVGSHIAACVNIIPKISSFYRWQGKVERTDEFLLLIKTTEAQAESVTKVINEISSYELPEVISVNISGGLTPYLEWLEAESRGK